MRVLGIETSCDETACAVLENGPNLLSNVVHSQESAHAPFGGVVPEIASRSHLLTLGRVVELSLERGGASPGDIEAVAVTRGPGLMGSLLVGLNFSKGLAISRGIPLLGVNHLDGHIQSIRFGAEVPEPPLVSLVVSGGHTALFLVEGWGEYRLLGATRDDAAGEAFDKVAKLLGLGYPGGAEIERLSRDGDEERYPLPRGMLRKGGFDFSFSGIKTAVLREVMRLREGGGRLEEESPHLAASFQRAVADVLVHKTLVAASSLSITRIAVTGGVARNSRIRERFETAGREEGFRVFFPGPSFCTDNAAMIAVSGLERLMRGERDDPRTLDADPYILP